MQVTLLGQYNAVCTIYSLHRKSPVHYESIPKTSLGLKMLVEACAWKQVVELSSILIAQENGNNMINNFTVDIPLLLKLRWEGLFHCKMFDEILLEVGKEADSIHKVTLDKSNYNSTCNDVSILLHILLSEVKVMTGHADDALRELYKIKEDLLPFTSGHETVDNAAKHVLLRRTNTSIINALIRQRLWRRAISELQIMLESTEKLLEQLSYQDTSPSILTTRKSLLLTIVALQCRLARTLLQIGARVLSAKYVALARSCVDSNTIECVDIVDHVYFAEGLVAFGYDHYEEAMHIFKSILERLIENDVSISVTTLSTVDVFNRGPDRPVDDLFPDSYQIVEGLPCFAIEGETLMAAVANNLSICALYLRQLPKAIETLEKLVQYNPVRHLVDPVVFNLCTMYDLSCAPEISATKKRVLQRIAVLYNVHDLNWRSFRLN